MQGLNEGERKTLILQMNLWFTSAMQGGRMENAIFGFVYFLLDTTGLSEDAILTFQEFYRRIRYVGRSVNVSRDDRPIEHEYEMLIEEAENELTNEKARRWRELSGQGRTLELIIVFEQVHVSWVRVFEHCMIMAMSHLATDGGESWNERIDQLDPDNDMLTDQSPMNLVYFGQYLIQRAFDAYNLGCQEDDEDIENEAESE